MRRLTKKGILMPETLKIILAVLSISLLVYLAVSLYGILNGQHKLQQAKATLESVTNTMKIMKQEDISEREVLILNPADWALVYVKDGPFNGADGDSYAVGSYTVSLNVFPSDSCGVNCLCICETKDSEGPSGVMGASVARKKEIDCRTSGACVILKDFVLLPDDKNILERGIPINKYAIKITREGDSFSIKPSS